MVFLAAIDSVTRTQAYFFYLAFKGSLCKVAKMCYISPKSTWRLISDDFPGTESTYKGLTVKRKPIQPLFNSGRPWKLRYRRQGRPTRAKKAGVLQLLYL